MTSRDQEQTDIAFVRTHTGMTHVDDPDALAAFLTEGIFDVDPHCRKLDAFVEKHKLDARIESEDLLPPMDEGG